MRDLFIIRLNSILRTSFVDAADCILTPLPPSLIPGEGMQNSDQSGSMPLSAMAERGRLRSRRG
jgi:hypothetical protein